MRPAIAMRPRTNSTLSSTSCSGAAKTITRSTSPLRRTG
jgi:hypothetical protein